MSTTRTFVNRALFARGVTLVEIMVAVAIMGILAAAAIPSYTDLINRRRLRAAASEVSTDLALLRSSAATRVQTSFMKFSSNSDMSCYTIQAFSTSVRCDCRKGVMKACPASMFGPSPELKTVLFQTANGITMTPGAKNYESLENAFGFSGITLKPALPDFSITLTSSVGSLRIKVNAVGRISTCSPNASFSGVPTC